jgi:hypothetical protein
MKFFAISRLCSTSMYAQTCRPSVAPEKLLRVQFATVVVSGAFRAVADGRIGLQHIVSLVCGLEPDNEVWDATTSTKNRADYWKQR